MTFHLKHTNIYNIHGGILILNEILKVKLKSFKILYDEVGNLIAL